MSSQHLPFKAYQPQASPCSTYPDLAMLVESLSAEALSTAQSAKSTSALHAGLS